MSKYKNKTSTETKEEANKIAKSTQRPGQSKDQTKLIAQGIRKGIEQYKKRYKSKARELDKKLKSTKISDSEINATSDKKMQRTQNISKSSPSIKYLPWFLLVLSWVGFLIWTQQ